MKCKWQQEGANPVSPLGFLSRDTGHSACARTGSILGADYKGGAPWRGVSSR